ncbi:GIY-YIG nuclease family protein [Candidatus Dependentiae bacterium]|nr:GIY-YIG nuclease family protein [Candidatus Dependentiae bacterium]
MFYVYYLKSVSFPDKTYIGFTTNLKQRLSDHNAGKSVYTKDFMPWKLIGFLGFDQEIKALTFERYLKSNAGRIFLKRYFKDSQKTETNCDKENNKCQRLFAINSDAIKG